MNLEEGKGGGGFSRQKRGKGERSQNRLLQNNQTGIGGYLYPNKDSSDPPIPKNTTHAPVDKNKRILKESVQNQ
jgi:hypothetical protein